MMKRYLCCLALGGLLATGAVMAQEPGGAPEQSEPQGGGMGQGNMGGMHGNHGGWMDPDQRLAHMTKHYKLTSDQQSQIKPLLQDEQQQMQSMRGDTSMSRDDKRAKMLSMHQATQQKIEAILTEDQRKKFDEDQKKMQERRAEHMGGMHGDGPGGDAGAPPPPQQ
jgi:periplasmic protein CpxP/Spy